MIYVTGDTHRAFDRIDEFCRKNKTTKEDVLVILGDAGINYYQNLRDEDLKMELDQLPITLFCIQGNHEKRASSIGTYEEMRWHDGIVYVEPKHPSILFAKDGGIFDLNGKKTIVIGGAYSIDKFYRVIRGWQWFPDEQPSAEIKEYVEAQLEAVHWKIDYVFSHTAPLKYEPILFNDLILSGRLWTYLADLNEQAQERLSLIVDQIKAAEGVTEEMKAADQMVWVGAMNSIRNRAEEIILRELIYGEDVA